jgi:hypothetical protein
MKRLKISHENPPIPVRDHDYRAYWDGDDESPGRHGWGSQPVEAWQDLLGQGDWSEKRLVQSFNPKTKDVFYTVDLSEAEFPKCGCPRFFHNCLDTAGNYIEGRVCKHIGPAIEHKRKEG